MTDIFKRMDKAMEKQMGKKKLLGTLPSIQAEGITPVDFQTSQKGVLVLTGKPRKTKLQNTLLKS